MLKQVVARLKEPIRQTLQRWRRTTNTSAAAKVAQLQLVLAWKAQRDLLAFDEVEFRAYSQNGEDGILLYLFSRIGTTNKMAVELCAGDGIECNAANLVLNHGWRALLVDGSIENVETARSFYGSHRDTFSFPPQVAHEWIERDTVNDVVARHGVTGDIDLLTIDLDGIDYWIWECLAVIRPRVVVVEVQIVWPADVSVSVPYARDFRGTFIDGLSVYSSASLAAFVKLARKKGYRLVGAQRLGFNAFFVREDIGHFPEMTAEECLDRPFVRQASARYLAKVRDREWVEV